MKDIKKQHQENKIQIMQFEAQTLSYKIDNFRLETTNFMPSSFYGKRLITKQAAAMHDYLDVLVIRIQLAIKESQNESE